MKICTLNMDQNFALIGFPEWDKWSVFCKGISHSHEKSNCGRADSVIDSHTTGARFKTGRVEYIFY